MGAFDVVIANHLLNELWVGKANALQSRVDFLERWTASLASDGLLFIAEPALLKTSREELAVRDELTGRGFSVLSPAWETGRALRLPQETDTPAMGKSDGNRLNRSRPRHGFTSGQRIGEDGLFLFQERENTKEIGSRRNVACASRFRWHAEQRGRLRYLLCDGARRFPFSARKDDPRAKAQGFWDCVGTIWWRSRILRFVKAGKRSLTA